MSSSSQFVPRVLITGVVVLSACQAASEQATSLQTAEPTQLSQTPMAAMSAEPAVRMHMPPPAAKPGSPPATATAAPTKLLPTHVARPDNWPEQEGYAGAPGKLFDYDCHGDEHGNWLCTTAMQNNSGPCAFGPKGELYAAQQAVFADTEASVIVSRFAATGTPEWTRVWNRSGGFATHTIWAHDMAVQSDGSLIWVGSDCIADSQRPAALDPGYYNGSCIEGYIAALSSAGELEWEQWLGTRDGADFASDVVVGPDDDLFIGGIFQPPFSIPGLLPPARNGNSDLFVLALDRTGSARWARNFGSEEHEGNRLAVAAAESGVVVAGGLTHSADAGGFAASLAANGDIRWQTEVPAKYSSDVVWIDGETISSAPTAWNVISEDGTLSSRAANAAMRMAVTPHGDLVTTTNGAPLRRTDVAGKVITQRNFQPAQEVWYYGGLCTGPQGEVALAGRIGPETHFDFLDGSAVTLTPGTTFVLHLASL